MQALPADPALEAASQAIMAASIVTWIYLLARWRRQGQILPLEPRQPVPWGLPAALVAAVVVALTFSAAVSSDHAKQPDADVRPAEAAAQIVGFMTFQIAVTVAALAVTLITSRPNIRDFGLPPTVVEGLRYLQIGVVACLAAIVPVFGVLALARHLIGHAEEPSHHPLVEAVFHGSNLGILLLAALSAVVLAPVCEEIIFRALLQGWLEKWEDELLGWRTHDTRGAPATVGDAAVGDCPDFPESARENRTVPLSAHGSETAANKNSPPSAIDYQPDDSPGKQPPTDDRLDHPSSTFTRPPRRGLAGLPYGWIPILISSLLFAAAHVGYGPEPVPLFVLALVLGYVYQRTHSVVPCVVAHGLFNLLSVIALWRLIELAAPR